MSVVHSSSTIIPFPSRRAHCVFLLRDGRIWRVQAYGHAWEHGSSAAADADAQWMSRNLELTIRQREAV